MLGLTGLMQEPTAVQRQDKSIRMPEIKGLFKQFTKKRITEDA
jgi:hypothetical protein